MHDRPVTVCFAPSASPTPPSALPWATQIDGSGIAALTAPAPAELAAFLPAPSATKSRGNPSLHLGPAQPARGLDPRGARTRSGYSCRSPAVDGKLRCPAGQARG